MTIYSLNILLFLCILLQVALPPSLPHHIEQNSLCYTVGPCWLSTLNIARGPLASSPTTRWSRAPCRPWRPSAPTSVRPSSRWRSWRPWSSCSHIKGWEVCLGQGEPSGLETDPGWRSAQLWVQTAVWAPASACSVFCLVCTLKKKKSSYFFNDIHMKVQISSFFKKIGNMGPHFPRHRPLEPLVFLPTTPQSLSFTCCLTFLVSFELRSRVVFKGSLQDRILALILLYGGFRHLS